MGGNIWRTKFEVTSCFRAIENNAAMNMCVWIYPWEPASNSSGHTPRSGTAGPCGSSTFTFWGTSMLLPTVVVWVHSPTSNAHVFYSTTSSLILFFPEIFPPCFCFWVIIFIVVTPVGVPPSFLKNNFTGYRILGYHLVFE